MWPGAVNGALEARGSRMRKIEAFTKTWMNESMDRAAEPSFATRLVV